MTEEKAEETQKEVKPDIELMAKVDADGRLTWKVPDNMQIAAWLLMHLDMAVKQKHKALVAESLKAESAKKPNIITAIRNSPIMKGLR